MKKTIAASTTILFAILFSTALFLGTAQAHCEIPCGIYDDQTRMTLIFEHAGTIEKSMKEIGKFSKENNPNQMVRWVMNKDKHADLLQEIVTQYFMTQRIKFTSSDYDKKLAALHKMLVYAMKCKQTTDLGNVEKLRAAAEEFKMLYFKH